MRRPRLRQDRLRLSDPRVARRGAGGRTRRLAFPGNGAEPVGGDVLAGPYPQHSRHRAGFRRIDRGDVGMGMERADDNQMRQLVEAQIGDETPASG